ncbi:hypothetical protein A4A49_26133 [Nicotiana attenuata]|uniref:Uncharacterized protein n=1 Tax=Nicotiana attenuata TaxID=49451 RepID=A0A1J6KPG6_NICAT|nr:hypothetical protein A4A49_26133 [Nicotiana attenuata]
MSKDLKKNLGSNIDTLLKILVKPDERNIEKESSVPNSKDAVDDHCDGTEPTVPINKDAGDDQCDDTDVHAEDHYESAYRDAHLEDEIDIESIDGVEVQDVVECKDQENPKETGVTEAIFKCGVQSHNLENPLGTSVKSFEAAREEDGVDYQERNGRQSHDLENIQGTSISEIICKCIEGTYHLSTPRSLTDNIGSQENASEDNDLTGMILTVAKESCELAIDDHGEQLQDKENATNMLARLSVEKYKKQTNVYVVLSLEQNKDETVNQYTRKRKGDSIGFDGPSFYILTPTPQTTQMSIDEGLSMEVEGSVEEELGRGKKNKKLSWQFEISF